jgi:hypothetical protein
MMGRSWRWDWQVVAFPFEAKPEKKKVESSDLDYSNHLFGALLLILQSKKSNNPETHT